jgi:cell division protein FtsB
VEDGMTENEKLPEDLEKKITEAEIEAQLEEDLAEEVSPPVEDASEDAPVEIPEEKKVLSKARQIWRRVLIWLVLIAIAFAAGFFVDSYLRYQPEKTRVAQLEAELEESAETISSLEHEIQELSLYEDKNEALIEEINQVTIHITLLSARTAVADARLAIEQDRTADAKLSLEKLGTTLEELKSLLTPDQADVVATMIQRQELIMLELDDDGYSAQTDLGVLASRLSSLENTLFATP